MAPRGPAEGNLAAVLTLFGAWRTCGACGRRVLFVNSQAGTDGDFLCGRCERRLEALARDCRTVAPPATSPPLRVALYLWALFGGVANDNPSAGRVVVS